MTTMNVKGLLQWQFRRLFRKLMFKMSLWLMHRRNTRIIERLLKRELIRRTGRSNIKVSIGPYDSDIGVGKDPDNGHFIVDFYDSLSPRRFIRAFEYASDIITNWEFYEVEREAEKAATRPIFERIQAKFPDIRLDYFVTIGDHTITARKSRANQPEVIFDLWLGMQEENIQRLEELVANILESLNENPEATKVEFLYHEHKELVIRGIGYGTLTEALRHIPGEES
jgi:hypothetical protein